MPTTSYAIALGSNRRGRHGSPEAEIAAALGALGGVVAVSPLLRTAPLGPSKRRFANAVALIESDETPPELLARLKAIERAFGRRRGRSWGARVIDLDIVLWSGGTWGEPGLTVPHAAFRARDFVLRPLLAVAPDWRDPVSGLRVRQLAARLGRLA
ncbi:2-amino-4-hydroxy-6-hydroxymethyldihydropteridine diphosphokinase [Sphingomonas naasensis]|uniref:2-amino-4-hydroxy-6-hydroxymethyldihydropteridine pyrophosphokinase n=1 Tax=Sphingomonas naasensis TaxID=1344951 RepID=A0A4S1WGZ7_9SPHN|nr:2-amino-4-hydroxy-6-hydroxymethyldihydropteridine diphosphokinase [Sphingomonas naasensis]NIJ21929.1 2-amino-4-hydroxy-6-hydroxymethyldihydropteridine diphosphokinase [Sphingomonas naasensis]TGX42381.1 2-amino-4-hydroxy-6-hydroxymethyldihydropteridine diphosphokinase [Sphingomonas naasensis]